MPKQKDKIKWIKPFTREIDPFDWEPGIRVYTEDFGGKTKAGFKNQMYLPEDGKHGFYYGAQDYQAFQNALLQKVKSGPSYLEKEAKLCFRTCEAMVSATKKLYSFLGKQSDKKIAQLYQTYLKKFATYCFYLEMIPAIETYLEETVKNLLTKALRDKSKKKLDDYFAIVSTKIKRVAAEKEEVDRLKLAQTLKEGKNIDKRLDQYLKKYAWLPFYGLETIIPLRKEDVLKEIKEITKSKQQLAKRLQEIKEQKKGLKQIKNEFRGNKELLWWIKILQDYLYLRTYRTDAYRRMLFHLKLFVDYLADKIGCKYREVIYLRPNEIIAYLKNQKPPSFKEIKARQKHWAIIVKDGRLEFTSDKKRIEEIKEKELPKEEKEIKTFKGNVAQKGKAKGIARVIRAKKDWRKIEKGNILVTHMTTPEMMAIIRKAAAIVTDEGGVTCHAAIVSRELGIPCVIATEIATKVLKDGDFVGVDANKGIVKILERAK